MNPYRVVKDIQDDPNHKSKKKQTVSGKFQRQQNDNDRVKQDVCISQEGVSKLQLTKYQNLNQQDEYRSDYMYQYQVTHRLRVVLVNYLHRIADS